MIQISRRPQAVRDLADTVIYISQFDPDSAFRFLEAAQYTFELLAKFPESGRMAGFTKPENIDLRQTQIKGFNRYLIFYRIIETGIEVVRVVYSGRDLNKLF